MPEKLLTDKEQKVIEAMTAARSCLSEIVNFLENGSMTGKIVLLISDE